MLNDQEALFADKGSIHSAKKKSIDHHGGRVAVFHVFLTIQLIYSQIPTSIHLVAYTLSDRLNQHRNGGQRE